MDNVFKAFAKISLKDKLIFLIVFILLACGIMAGLLKLSMMGISSEYPDCTLAPIGDLHPREELSYEDLPTDIVFPGTSMGVSMGGSPLKTEDDLAVFEYGNGFTIVAFRSGDDFKKAATAYIPQAMQTRKFTSYEAKVTGHGYLNAMEMDYSAGLIRCSDAPYYCIFYVMDGCTVGIVTKENDAMSDAKKILDRIASTFTGESGFSVKESAGMTEDVTSGDGEKKTEGPSDNKKAEPSEDDELVLNDYPDGIKGDIDYSRFTEGVASVDKGLAGKDCFFLFQYVNVDETPSDAYLVSPSGKVYAPFYVNDAGDGCIKFEVKNTEEGRWLCYVTNEDDIGAFDVYAVSSEGYENLTPNSMREDDAVPREP